MRNLIRTAGWGFLGIAVVCGALGFWAWPPGGLMFALPYLFLIPGGAFAIIGILLLVFGHMGSTNDKE